MIWRDDMKLSTKPRYALRILIQLAFDVEKGNKSARGRDIAKKQHISEPYIEQMMMPLRAAKIVKTIRGCKGGYTLAKDPENITVLDIIELFEGPLSLVHCEKTDKSCDNFANCFTRDVWKKLSDTLKTEASKITLANIVKDVKEHSCPDYFI